MAKRLLLGVLLLAAARPPGARAGGAVFRAVAPRSSVSMRAVPPASAPLSGAAVPVLSAAPSLSVAPLPAAAAPVPDPALRGMEAMMLRDLRREEPRRLAIMKEQELYRESMARVERERRPSPSLAAANPAPHVRQETEYTCGPACLRSALLARGLEAPPEAELARELGTDERDGTTPEALAEGARRRGLNARTAEHMTLKGLRRAVRKGRMVIVNIQSGGEGHWAIVTGAGEGRLLLMDPFEDAYPSALAEDRFLEAWWGFHHGRLYRRAAVVLGP